MSDPWEFIYKQTGFDPLDQYARKERADAEEDARLRAELEISAPGVRWEYCEIVCIRSGFFRAKNYFLAQAGGSKGIYEAARSTQKFYAESPTTSIGEEKGWPLTSSRKEELMAKAALDEIMTKLSADGWVLTGQRGKWWEYKYRRPERS